MIFIKTETDFILHYLLNLKPNIKMKNTTLLFSLLLIVIVQQLSAQSISDTLLSANAYIESGNNKYDNDDFEGAIVKYSKAIKLEPNNAYAYVLRGRAQMELYNYDEALIDFNKSISLNANDPFFYFQRGKLKYYTEDFTESVSDLSKAIELHPKYEIAYLFRGDSKIELNDYKGALLDYTKSSELRPTAYSKKKIGDANNKLGNYKDAIINYNEALEMYHNYPEALLGRGICKSYIGDIQGAKEDFIKSIELDPGNGFGYYLMGDISTGEQAVYYFTKSIEIFPKYGPSYLYRGFAYRDLKKYNKAISDLKRSMELDSSLARLVLEEIGDIYFEQKKYNDAITEYTKAIKLNPTRLILYFQVARSKSNLGDEKGAINDYKELLGMKKETSDPDGFLWGTVYNNIGYCYISLNDLVNAEKYLNIAVKLEPNENYIWGSLAHLYYKKGQYQKCIDSANKSIKIFLNKSSKVESEEPGFPYYIRAMANIKLGKNKKQSCLDLSKARELGYAKAYDVIKEYCNKQY